jgi:arylsulfatase A
LAALTGQALATDGCLDSFNLLGALLGEPDAHGRDHLLQQSNDGGNLGLRAGDWKLVRIQKRWSGQAIVSRPAVAEQAGPFALYHLPSDPGERHDVSAKHPEVFQRLQDQMQQLVASGRSRPAQ